MRAFLIALIILFSVCVLLGINSIAVQRRTEEMLQLCQTLARTSASADADALYRKWQSCRSFLSLSVHRSEIDRADSALLAMREASEDSEGKRIQLALFRETLRRIRESQRLSLSQLW